jgi:hypothetical protein
MQSQPRGPIRPLGYHPIPTWNTLLDSDRTVEVLIRFRSKLPINETSVGKDDRISRILPLLRAPNRWSLIDTRDTCAVCESHLREQ